MLRYDFDVFTTPDSDPKKPKIVVQFRDPRTIEALKGADAVVQKYLQTCGFVQEVSQTGMPAGRYLIEDKPFRDAVVRRMVDRMRMLQSGKRNWNGFDLKAFMQAYQNAAPVDTAKVIASRARKPAQQSSASGVWELVAIAGMVLLGAMAVVAVS